MLFRNVICATEEGPVVNLNWSRTVISRVKAARAGESDELLLTYANQC